MAQYDNNVVTLIGTITEDLQFSHKTYNESFYKTFISIERLNKDIHDVIPLTISERLIDIDSIGEGTRVKVSGQFRSYNKFNADKQKKSLILFVFVKDIVNVSAIESTEDDITEDQAALLRECAKDKNEIILDGFTCKPPVYRKTPLGREITDLLVAVNRYKKAYYIPCIAWGRNARFFSGTEVGTELNITGRIQSRTYQKKIGENQFADPVVVYEVSIISAGIVSDYDSSSDNDIEVAEPVDIADSNIN